MLRLRRAELQSQVAAGSARLAQVEARLEIIEREGTMPADDIQIKRIPAVRVAELTAPAASFEPESINPVIGPLYDELFGLLQRAGVTPVGPSIAYYEDAPDGDGVLVHAAVPVNADPGGDRGSRSWIFRRSSRRPRSCTTAPWTTSCRRSRPWPAGSRPTGTVPSAITASCTSSAAPNGTRG